VEKNELVALKEISAGEEITYDYSTTMNDDKSEILEKAKRLPWKCACHCGTKSCRGTINQFKTLSQKLQKYYVRNKLLPDFMLRHFDV
jgi:hypothetical protein